MGALFSVTVNVIKNRKTLLSSNPSLPTTFIHVMFAVLRNAGIC